jgi:hypothetical protein
MTIAIAPAPRMVSPNGTIGSQALLRAVDHADSRALGRTYIARSQLVLSSALCKLTKFCATFLVYQLISTSEIQAAYLLFDEETETGREPK